MKQLLIFIACLSLTGCALFQSPHQRAQRHINKALRLDPGIITTFNVDTTIRGEVDTVIKTTAPAIDRSTVYFTLDSLMSELDRAQAAAKASGDGLAPAVYLYKDSVASIQVKKQDDKVAVMFHVEPRVIYDTFKIPYEVKVTIPGKQVNVEVFKPAWRYFWFWLMVLALLLSLILLIRGREKNGATIVNNPK